MLRMQEIGTSTVRMCGPMLLNDTEKKDEPKYEG
jgi:hypothetical protein